MRVQGETGICSTRPRSRVPHEGPGGAKGGLPIPSDHVCMPRSDVGCAQKTKKGGVGSLLASEAGKRGERPTLACLGRVVHL